MKVCIVMYTFLRTLLMYVWLIFEYPHKRDCCSFTLAPYQNICFQKNFTNFVCFQKNFTQNSAIYVIYDWFVMSSLLSTPQNYKQLKQHHS